MPATTNHPSFPQADDHELLWKYLDLEFFLDLMLRSELNLTRADQFDDPFEGRLPSRNFEADVVGPLLKATAPEKERRFLTNLDQVYRSLPASCFVSSWHRNEHESAAMWKLYSRTRNSVALKCRYSKVRDALPEPCLIGKVTYLNYNSEVIADRGVLAPLMHKRKEFEYEREVRLVHLGTREDPDRLSLKVPVALAGMVDAVVVSPGSQDFFVSLVEDLVARFGYSFAVYRSELYEPPRDSFSAVRSPC